MARSYSIAAASVLAKVHRDRLLVELDGVYPGYGLAKHKGYCSREHMAALERLDRLRCTAGTGVRSETMLDFDSAPNLDGIAEPMLQLD